MVSICIFSLQYCFQAFYCYVQTNSILKRTKFTVCKESPRLADLRICNESPGWKIVEWIELKKVYWFCALLGCYSSNSGNSLPAFRDNLSVPSSRAKKSQKSCISWPTGYAETMVRNYDYTLHNRVGRVVGIATGYGLDGPRIESRWGARFSAPVQTGPGAHPASCTMGTRSFPGVNSGRGVTLTPHPF